MTTARPRWRPFPFGLRESLCGTTRGEEPMSNARIDILATALAAVDDANDDLSFSELLEIASRGGAFDRTRHLRFADWRGIDFAESDLSGCDFSGALLVG